MFWFRLRTIGIYARVPATAEYRMSRLVNGRACNQQKSINFLITILIRLWIEENVFAQILILFSAVSSSLTQTQASEWNDEKFQSVAAKENSDKNSREIGMPTAAAEQSEAIKVIAQVNLHNKKRNTMRPRENNKIRTQNLHKYLHNLVQMFRPEFPTRGRRGQEWIERSQHSYGHKHSKCKYFLIELFGSDYIPHTKNSTTVRPCKTILRQPNFSPFRFVLLMRK